MPTKFINTLNGHLPGWHDVTCYHQKPFFCKDSYAFMRKGRMLKATSFISLDLHLSVIKNRPNRGLLVCLKIYSKMAYARWKKFDNDAIGPINLCWLDKGYRIAERNNRMAELNHFRPFSDLTNLGSRPLSLIFEHIVCPHCFKPQIF